MGTLLESRIQPVPGLFAGHPDAPRDFSRGARQSQGSWSPESFTLVAAKIELGKENSLYIRGHGEGLRWGLGQPLTCVDGATWLWSAYRAREPIEFHLLLDDLIWARGDNLLLEPGRVVELRPDFEWPEIPQAVSVGSRQ